MNIKNSAKLGAIILLFLFFLSSAISLFFIYRMQNNFSLAEALSTRFTDVQEARYELATMRSNVNFIMQNSEESNAVDDKVIGQTKALAVNAKKIITSWVTEKKNTAQAQESAIAVSKLFNNLIDRLLLSINNINSIDFKDETFASDFEHLSKLFDNYFLITKTNNDTISHQQLSMVHFSLYSTLISLIILLTMLYVVIRWVNEKFIFNLNLLSDILKKVGEGNLVFTLPKESKDEFGKLFSHVSDMQKSLTSTILAVKKEASEMKKEATEIASGNQELSSRTEEQASALQQTAASMEEIKTAVANNTENTVLANDITTEAHNVAMDGSIIMKDAISSMKKIENGAVKVGEINDVINGIASQTNILALNAAVEAARAGDQGRGFRVVAVEVRNLAAKSAEAAKEINHIIKESMADVSHGTQLVNKTGEHMEEMVSSITKLNKIMQGISLASEEQSLGIEQIAVAINQMDTVVQQNASLVDQSATSTMMLDEKAQLLMDNVAVFQVEEHA
ncbi:methyl-accepting chemotaxis protein [Proteus cibi]|uniref:methyl-accepting chemotaxis protein n=1 Tax=Proteus cibi TaxID=2050966 RepID=UPI000D68BBCC|nr:methyl-accepting chemotaxis protein [Proteus cibi]MBS6209690.1 methyl-accepting chemotaxis protein [Proteus hauseri]